MFDLSNWLSKTCGVTLHVLNMVQEAWPIWTHVAADSAIGFSYLVISLMLALIAHRRQDLMFKSAFWIFAGFILLCGAGHFLDLLTLWVPVRHLHALEKGATALVSVMTAIVLYRTLPTILKLRSTAQMRIVDDALLESEVHYRRAFEHSPMPLFTLDARGLVTGVSARLLELLDYTRAEVLGQRFTTFLDPFRTGEAVTYGRALATRGELRDIERRIPRRDGRLVDVLISAQLEKGVDGDVRILGALIDITDRRRAEADLRQTRIFMDTVIENLPEALFVKNATDLKYVLINRAAEDLLGYNPVEMIGKNDSELFSAADAKAFAADDRQVLASRQPTLIEETVHTRHNGVRRLKTRKVVVANDAGKSLYLLGFAEDVTDQHDAAARITHMAHNDPLTGLVNRTFFEAQLSATIAADQPAAVLILDLDGFKQVNDALGHGAGDDVLRAAARRLTDSLKTLQPPIAAPLIGRLGGDEFALLLPGLRSPAEVEAVAAALIAALATPFGHGPRTFQLGASIGTVMSPADGLDAESLIASADLALYAAKAAGGLTSRAMTQVLRHNYDIRRRLEGEVADAAGRDEFVIYYQPQISLVNGQLVGAEALLRWRHPTQGLLLPSAFLSALEAGPATAVAALGEWILDQACSQAALWRRAGMQNLRISVNLFEAQLRADDFVASIEATLARTGLPGAALDLELTENTVLGYDEQLLLALRQLRALGVGLALDDFGTGFASLVTLKRLPVTRLKIDRCFVDHLGINPHDEAIVTAMLALAKRLELDVTAEGIETIQQSATLKRLQCGTGQGYLYGAPMAPDAFFTSMSARVTAAA